jgi:hypothetical protein
MVFDKHILKRIKVKQSMKNTNKIITKKYDLKNYIA